MGGMESASISFWEDYFSAGLLYRNPEVPPRAGRELYFWGRLSSPRRP